MKSMALMEAKCTNCGGKLQIDNKKEAAVCPYCGSTFIVEKGIFGADMKVSLENDGPFTIVLDSKEIIK